MHHSQLEMHSYLIFSGHCLQKVQVVTAVELQEVLFLSWYWSETLHEPPCMCLSQMPCEQVSADACTSMHLCVLYTFNSICTSKGRTLCSVA